MLFSCSNDELSNKTDTTQNNFQNRKTENEFVSEEQAIIVAYNFYLKNKISKFDEIKIKSVDIVKDYNKETAVYSVNFEPSGFVLVSSNIRNMPVIAFSENNSFSLDNNSSDGLKSWIAESIILGDELEKMEKPIKEIENQWSDLGVGNKAPPIDNEVISNAGIVNSQYGPLLQTTWGQLNGYNDFCPTLGCAGNGRAPSGCVATAVAQVMKYHQWPNTFSWSSMSNYFGSQATSILMKNIGDNIGMNYACSGSGAQVGTARDALVNIYGYAGYANYNAYNINTTAVDIKNNRPVIMDGFHTQTTNGWWFWEYTTNHDGHAWVCDGFKENYIRLIHNPGTVYEYETAGNYTNWLHMNWGWDGAGQGYSNNNGWFFSNQIYVNGVQILVNGNAVNPNFQYNRKCIYLIRKP